MNHRGTDVLVAGAGLTGLAVAAKLAAAGIDVTVIDSQASGDNTSRAAVVHARTLEVLADLGVSARLVEEGIEGDLPRDEVILYFSPEGTLVFAPLPDGSVRLVAPVEDAPAEPGIDYVQGLIDRRGPASKAATNSVKVTEVVWGSRFRVHHRVADAYRAGRVLIAGDAAHVHSPAGGQGMNIGLQDAVVLGDALVALLTATAPDDTVLDAYGARRRPVAQDVIALSDRLTRFGLAHGARRGVRNLVLSTLARFPRFRRMLAWRLSGLVYRDR